MNSRRKLMTAAADAHKALAATHARLADIYADLAEELGATAPANDASPVPPKSKPRTLRGRPFPAPLNVVNDLDKSIGQDMLKKRGGQ